jgi:hypothetical protein
MKKKPAGIQAASSTVLYASPPTPLCWRTFPLRRIPVTVYIRSILLDELINSLSL